MLTGHIGSRVQGPLNSLGNTWLLLFLFRMLFFIFIIIQQTTDRTSNVHTNTLYTILFRKTTSTTAIIAIEQSMCVRVWGNDGNIIHDFVSLFFMVSFLSLPVCHFSIQVFPQQNEIHISDKKNKIKNIIWNRECVEHAATS